MAAQQVACHAEAVQHVKAAVGVVFEAFADPTTWATWADQQTEVLQPGSRDAYGEGMVVGSNTLWGSTLELVTSYTRNERITYTQLAGGYPICDHTAEVLFDSHPGGGTIVTWRCRFNPQVWGTGWLLQRMIQAHYRQTLSRLAAHLETPMVHVAGQALP
eukprot:comp7103_c0_seq1/m.2831 comp7103_c0_seq1/g.2831  ORF comp7103_c0_seq1/g.2831 comp7103_c0_seq1/m.2831 type:complete len:160 (-) comp7103_c0_seq1:202-681(-)